MFKLIYINQNGGKIELGEFNNIEVIKKYLTTNPYNFCFEDKNTIYYRFFRFFVNKINNLNKTEEIEKAVKNYIYNAKIKIIKVN